MSAEYQSDNTFDYQLKNRRSKLISIKVGTKQFRNEIARSLPVHFRLTFFFNQLNFAKYI